MFRRPGAGGGELFGDGRTLDSVEARRSVLYATGFVDTWLSLEGQDLGTLVCDDGCRPTALAAFASRVYPTFDTGFDGAGRGSIARYGWMAVRNGAVLDEDSCDS